MGMAPAQKARKGRFSGLDFGTPPTLSISASMTGLDLDASGSASDFENGDLSASIVWSSDIDGALGTGASITATLTAGAHVITAEVSDGTNTTTATENVVAA